eukprot:6190049-Pleurochrysis_carterae.AAC.3
MPITHGLVCVQSLRLTLVTDDKKAQLSNAFDFKESSREGLTLAIHTTCTTLVPTAYPRHHEQQVAVLVAREA